MSTPASSSASGGAAMAAHRGSGNLADIMFELSVNFLLYVVLIVVFYMLVRFYLEEEVTTRPGYFKVPTEDVDEEEEEVGIAPMGSEEGSDQLIAEGSSSGSSSSSGVGVEMKAVGASGEQAAPVKKSRMGRSNSGSFLNINEWGEPEGTRQEVLQKVLFCAAGLNISFCIWGLAQERILTQTYGGVFFEYSYGLVFLNRLGGLILSSCLMYYLKVDWVSSALWEYSFPSVANMLSSWCQYEALKYVSFPMVMLAKALKMVPIMLMGKFLNNSSYETYEYVCAATVGFGLYLFLSSSEHIDLRQNVFGDPESITGAMCGVVLLVLFLFFDSFTGQWQSRMFQLNKSMSPLQMMLIMNAFSATFSFVTLVHQEELFLSMAFVYEHPNMGLHLLVFCVCSTVGQLFIFYTVKNFGAVVFAIIMSVRILLSTILSCVVYKHPINELGILGIVVVFGANAYRINMKTQGKPLLRWKDTDHSGLVFKEWHEHLDI
ncbi:UAA transporter family-domain-containing protein [Ochromonadaceae sp. CCMP2298]|nr:UAA transporter family-domain-containing protein [Ochromonadaceae sp. CCMP2298]